MALASNDMPTKPSSFSSRLRAAREAAGLSIPALAALCNMPRQTIHLLESGQRQPSLATATTLATALGMSLDKLAGMPRRKRVQ